VTELVTTLAAVTDRSTPSRHERRIARIVMRIGERTERYATYLAGGLAGASTLLGTLVGFDARLLLPTGVLLVAAGVLVVAHDRWLTSRALQRELDIAADRVAVEASSTAELEALAERHSVVADAFAEIASAAADMADMSKRERARAFERLVKQSVDAIAYLLHGDIPGVRAVVYQVDSAGTLLEPVDKASNGYRQPPSPFVAGTVRGDTAFEILRSGRSLFVDDITTAPGDWAESGNGYNTFITTPIVTPTGAFGLVTVDAPLTDTLTEEDENDLRLIAGILAVVFAEHRRRTPGRSAVDPSRSVDPTVNSTS
jgi:hypothetical protein